MFCNTFCGNFKSSKSSKTKPNILFTYSILKSTYLSLTIKCQNTIHVRVTRSRGGGEKECKQREDKMNSVKIKKLN